MRIPRFPEDFRVVATSTTSYWVWGPDEGPCLMVSGDDPASRLLQHGGMVDVSWEYGPETESGPFRRGRWDCTDPESVQQMVEAVMLEVAEEKIVAASVPVREPAIVAHRFESAIHSKMTWCAYRDGEEELGGYGWGATEKEAIDDYLSRLD